ncbi:hypothetical protein HYX10_00630 [Candidatus Woesearchaeota archaeon]|nr:hypothetical protein [Candidatus Woesearchaeota archaeon]
MATVNNKCLGLSKDIDNPGFILTNRAGSFFSFSSNPESKYHGYFASLGNRLYKVIESLQAADVPQQFDYYPGRVAIIRGSRSESVFLPHYYNSLCYVLSKSADVDVFLDCMLASDFREWGRYYNAHFKDNALVVEFVKKTDGRDSAAGLDEFKLYLAVRSDGACNKLGHWVKRDYRLDRQRGSLSERYVYRAFSVHASKMVFSAALSEDAALSESEYVFSHMHGLQEKSRKSSVLELAKSSYDALVTAEDVYAGLPWFYQYWSRDSVISSSAAGMLLRKRLLFRYLGRIGRDGRIASIGIGSSDSVGWLFFRLRQLYEAKALTGSEILEVKAALKNSLGRQQEFYGRSGLIFSSKNESWMDTDFGDNGREGFPVEVQALTLASLNFLWLLSKKQSVRNQESAMADKARAGFWNRKYLADLAFDFTIRPNVFIAAYAYPKLLSKKEWETCFDNVLPHLWLDWGGLASIDKAHPLFQENYTGENSKSYHRGDSWYWINNLAAVVMARLNRKKYGYYIKKIKDASVNDLLWLGAVGCCSELSSASQQKAEGCLSQAWSCSTLIELLQELKSG